MAVTAAEIWDQVSLEAWLDARPEATKRQVAVVLANRSSMRAAPTLGRTGKLSLREQSVLLKNSFRENLVSWVASTNPASEIDTDSLVSRAIPLRAARSTLAAASAASAAASAASSLGSRAFKRSVIVANFAITATVLAASAANHAATDTAVTSGAFASVASVGSAAEDTIWEATREDARALESGADVHELMLRPLWRSPPSWWQFELQTSLQNLRNSNLLERHFDIWVEWYEAVAFGKPAFGIRSEKARNALERNIALGSADGTFNQEFWGRNPATINAHIKRWVEETRAKDELERAIAEAPGTSWTATLKGYQLHYGGDASDADVAASPETAFEHEQLRKVLAKLIQKSPAISRRQGWEDFHGAVEEIQNAIECRSDQLHARILQIYHYGLRLTTFLDQDNNLRAARGRNFANALEATESRLLLEAIQYIHPWIGRFPTAKRKDHEAGQVYRKMTETAILAHVQLVNQARAVDLISEKDRALLQQLVELLSKSDLVYGVPAEKLQAHGSWTVKQLVYAMALHVAVAVPLEMTTDVAKETQTWKVTKEFLVTNIKIVEEVITDAPAHVQTIIKTIIQSERDKTPSSDVVEVPVAQVGNRRKRTHPRR